MPQLNSCSSLAINPLVWLLVLLGAAALAACGGTAPVETRSPASDTPVPVETRSPTASTPTVETISSTTNTPVPVETRSPTADTPPVETISPAADAPVPVVTVGSAALTVELALTPAQRVQGLSGRPELARGTGMLFVYTQEGRHSFWMIDMNFPLDLVWISAQCTVIEITSNVPPPAPGQTSAELPRYVPETPVQYVLEVNAGDMESAGIQVGDPGGVHWQPDRALRLLKPLSLAGLNDSSRPPLAGIASG